MENCCADRELSHFQGRTNDRLDVADVDLAGNVQSATGSTFDHIPLLVARGGFHREELIGLGVHRGAEEMKSEISAGDEVVRVNAGEEASQVLVVDVWGMLSIKVSLFKSWMSSNTSPLARLCGKAVGMSW